MHSLLLFLLLRKRTSIPVLELPAKGCCFLCASSMEKPEPSLEGTTQGTGKQHIFSSFELCCCYCGGDCDLGAKTSRGTDQLAARKVSGFSAQADRRTNKSPVECLQFTEDTTVRAAVDTVQVTDFITQTR